MRCSLRCKLLLLFVCISLIALSSAIILRNLIIRDFNQYLDGDAQDRIQRVIAQLEGRYDASGFGDRNALAVDLAWALQMGMEARLTDSSARPVMDTAQAVTLLTPLMRKRVLDVSGFDTLKARGDFTAYPLFLRGEEIGRIELRLMQQLKDDYFITSSNQILLLSVALLGLVSIVAGVIASRRFSRPLLALAEAAGDIADGNLARRVVATASDETGLLAKSFNRMADSLEAQEKLRRTLVTGAAHELRTPLAIISGELEGMIDGLLPVSREGLQSMHEETRRLAVILDGVDDLARAEASFMNLQKENLELRPFLVALADRFERLFAEKGALLSIDCPPGLSAWVDPDRLSQVAINLLTNALKAVARDGKISVSAAAVAAGTVIEIRDNGCGIPHSELSAVFERFYKGKNGGLGLGLAIARELVAAHGGSIEVASALGEGTVFRVVLPARH